RATVETVPFWFHTFALNRAEGIYTPGAARDHRYRVCALPEDFAGMSVLDVGCFDGFYAFLAERRGAERVVAVDNEQYRLWVASRRGGELDGGEGFRAMHGLLGSAVEYRRMDAFALAALEERFDLVYCFGILHRVENPLGLLRVLRGQTVDGGTVLLETYGVDPEVRHGPAIRVSEPGEVYARDDFIYWGFTNAGLERLARIAGFSRADSLVDVEVDGHPRFRPGWSPRPLPDGVLHNLLTRRLQARNEKARQCRERCWSAPGAIRPPPRPRVRP
ncbi:MAG: class I SAM-dependent methyltransferase, partial [Solirubrobacteraceae bacterium]